MKTEIDGYDVIIALENQQYDDRSMALRVYGYDYMDYLKQYNEDKILIPVFTVVIYYGEMKKIRLKSLKEMTMGIPDVLKDKFDDKHVIFIDIKTVNPEFIDDEETRNLVIAIQRLYQFKDISTLAGLKLTKLAAIVAGRLTGTPALIERAYKEKGEEVNMCQAVENYYNRKMEENASALSIYYNKKIEEKLLELDKQKRKEMEEKENQIQVDILFSQLSRAIGELSKQTREMIQNSSIDKVQNILVNIFDIHNESDILRMIRE